MKQEQVVNISEMEHFLIKSGVGALKWCSENGVNDHQVYGNRLTRSEAVL